MPKLKIYRCRVCGCTEDRACDGGCSWMEPNDGGGPLCTACPGTEGDLEEVLTRAIKVLAGPKDHKSARLALRMFRLRRRNHVALLADIERQREKNTKKRRPIPIKSRSTVLVGGHE